MAITNVAVVSCTKISIKGNMQLYRGLIAKTSPEKRYIEIH